MDRLPGRFPGDWYAPGGGGGSCPKFRYPAGILLVREAGGVVMDPSGKGL